MDLPKLLDSIAELTEFCVELIADVADEEERAAAEVRIAALEAQRAEAVTYAREFKRKRGIR
ncbi:MAG: hypothetical protein ACHQ0J_05035 [Candidatus Dormibacterales bacterium]